MRSSEPRPEAEKGQPDETQDRDVHRVENPQGIRWQRADAEFT
jgi:hypothetical protein